jgi:hypothetical protein
MPGNPKKYSKLREILLFLAWGLLATTLAFMLILLAALLGWGI